MPDADRAVSRLPPALSRSRDLAPVSTSSKELFDTSSAVHLRSTPQSIPDRVIARPFPTCLPPRLLNAAAVGGLKPPPARRLRGGHPPSLVQHGCTEGLRPPVRLRGARSPKFLGDPCLHALLFDPGGPLASGHSDARDVAFRIYNYVGSASGLSRLNHTAYRLPVYASQPGSPPHHATLGSGWWPALAGQVLHLLGR